MTSITGVSILHAAVKHLLPKNVPFYKYIYTFLFWLIEIPNTFVGTLEHI